MAHKVLLSQYPQGLQLIKTLNLKNRKVIIAGDWDGSCKAPSWHAMEKAKAVLEYKGNKVEIILPVKNPEKRPELTNLKVDFNDLLKQWGAKSVIDRISDLFPEVIGKASSLRETISEGSHDKQKDTQVSKIKASLTRDGVLTDNSKITSPILEKMESKIASEKVAHPQVILPKFSPFKTNPFDVKKCTNDLGR